jgi:hypothetical protein
MSLVVVFAVAFLVYRLIRPSLRQLLEDITVLPAATEFYLRSFAIIVFLVAGSNALGSAHGDLSATSRFMEYVWSIADTVESAMEGIFGVLLGYVAMITILVAALRRRQL